MNRDPVVDARGRDVVDDLAKTMRTEATRKHLGNSRIAQLTGLPGRTVRRVMSGDTFSPYSVIAVLDVLGLDLQLARKNRNT